MGEIAKRNTIDNDDGKAPARKWEDTLQFICNVTANNPDLIENCLQLVPLENILQPGLRYVHTAYNCLRIIG
jgi:hypothetical protein